MTSIALPAGRRKTARRRARREHRRAETGPRGCASGGREPAPARRAAARGGDFRGLLLGRRWSIVEESFLGRLPSYQGEKKKCRRRPSSARPSPRRPPRWPGLAFAATILLSAFLLFQVQPLISKFILPWFGGCPAVWTTCMLFFQVVLFAGYSYAHLAGSRLTLRGQAIVQVGLLLRRPLVALLPIAPGRKLETHRQRGPDVAESCCC